MHIHIYQGIHPLTHTFADIHTQTHTPTNTHARTRTHVLSAYYFINTDNETVVKHNSNTKHVIIILCQKYYYKLSEVQWITLFRYKGSEIMVNYVHVFVSLSYKLAVLAFFVPTTRV